MSRAALISGLATAKLGQWEDLWTDGWFLWSVYDDINPATAMVNKPETIPSGTLLAVRAFTWIEYIDIGSWKRRYPYIGVGVAHALSELQESGFEPIEVPSFSKNHIEMVLVDLDQWLEEHSAEEAKDVVGVIRTTNWLLKHGKLRTKDLD